MSNMLVSSSPHIRAKTDTASIMRDVCIALIPSLICSIIYFGIRSLFITALCVVFCVGFEFLWQKLTKKAITISDGTAIVTGMLLGFNLPVTVPWWICLIGAFVSIIIAKQFFGGIGHNFINPALAGRAFLLASWPVIMTNWVEPFTTGFSVPVDVVSSATPLAILKDPTIGTFPDFIDLFLGNVAGCLGGTPVLALLIGAAYLLFKRVISLRIPATYIITLALLAFVFPNEGFSGFESVCANIISGSLILGAFYMATDYVTSPITNSGQIIMGFGCGVLTFVIRRFGGYPEGVCYSILLMNILTPLIDRFTKPVPFGTMKAAKGGNK